MYDSLDFIMIATSAVVSRAGGGNPSGFFHKKAGSIP
jgi:hypothetical protein